MRALTSAMGHRPCPRAWAGSRGPVHFRCSLQVHCFSLGCSLQISAQFTHSTLPAGRKKKTKPSYRLSIRGTHDNTHKGKTPLLLLSLVTPATSESLPELQPPSQGSTWPSVHPDLPLLELSNFRVSCRLSKANSSTIT